MGIKIGGVITLPLDRGLARFRLCIEQAPDRCDPVTPDAICEEARVADAVEARRQDMDQETADELVRGQTHGLHAITALDAVVFPAESYGVGISNHEAVVRDRDAVCVSAQIGQHRLRSAEGGLGIHNPVSFAQWREMGGEGSWVGQSGQGPAEGSDNSIDLVLGLSDGSSDIENALYDTAVAIVIKDRKCSTSYIQRKLAIGYNKAARLVEQMEDEGVVSSANHVGKREILVPEQHH